MRKDDYNGMADETGGERMKNVIDDIRTGKVRLFTTRRKKAGIFGTIEDIKALLGAPFMRRKF